MCRERIGGERGAGREEAKSPVASVVAHTSEEVTWTRVVGVESRGSKRGPDKLWR